MRSTDRPWPMDRLVFGPGGISAIMESRDQSPQLENELLRRLEQRIHKTVSSEVVGVPIVVKQRPWNSTGNNSTKTQQGSNIPQRKTYLETYQTWPDTWNCSASLASNYEPIIESHAYSKVPEDLKLYQLGQKKHGINGVLSNRSIDIDIAQMRQDSRASLSSDVSDYTHSGTLSTNRSIPSTGSSRIGYDSDHQTKSQEGSSKYRQDSANSQRVGLRDRSLTPTKVQSNRSESSMSSRMRSLPPSPIPVVNMNLLHSQAVKNLKQERCASTGWISEAFPCHRLKTQRPKSQPSGKEELKSSLQLSFAEDPPTMSSFLPHSVLPGKKLSHIPQQNISLCKEKGSRPKKTSPKSPIRKLILMDESLPRTPQSEESAFDDLQISAIELQKFIPNGGN